MRAKFASHALAVRREQSGVSDSSDDVLNALIEGNRRYEERFGFIFIVCASGKSAEEMLALLHARMNNDALDRTSRRRRGAREDLRAPLDGRRVDSRLRVVPITL